MAKLRDGWISVDKRLPGECESVIGWFRNYESSAFEVGEVFMGAEKWYSVRDDYDIVEITHWRPLPSPPKEFQHGKAK